jgi:hypothetical protein
MEKVIFLLKDCKSHGLWVLLVKFGMVVWILRNVLLMGFGMGNFSKSREQWVSGVGQYI